MSTDLSAYTYTRYISIGGVSFTALCDQISFEWGECGGPRTARMTIKSAGFDETFGIRQGDDVDIRLGTAAATRMWRGIITEIETGINGSGLSLTAVGPKILLMESVPDGLFGTLADTGPPTNLSATQSAAAAGAPGFDDTYSFWVIARSIDAEGTTNYNDTTINPATPLGGDLGSGVLAFAAGVITAGYQLDLSWTCGQNATGTEIEVIYDPFGANQSLEFYDAVGDSLSIDGAFSPTEGTNFSAVNTARQATIAGTTIEDIVNHLLDNWLPVGMTKGTVEIGTLNVDVDLIDLRNAGADLNQILSTLRDIAGDVQWYVDPDYAVHFVERGTTVAATFQIQASAGPLSTTHDALVGLSKRQERDGITVVKVEGELGLEDANLENDDPDWDSTTETASADPDYAAITRDARVFSCGVSRANSPEIPVGATKANFIDTYASLQLWLNDFPNLRLLYVKKESLPDAFITQTLDRIRTKVFAPSDPFSPSAAAGDTIGNRPRLLTVSAPGVSTIQSAGILATNYMLKRNPNPVQWNATLANVKTLYIPGQDRIKIINTQGYIYNLPILSVSYTFGESITAQMTLGDPTFNMAEEATLQERSLSKLSLRKQQVPRWET